MLLTHIFAVLGGALLGAVSHKLYAAHRKKIYWGSVVSGLRYRKSRSHSMRAKRNFPVRAAYRNRFDLRDLRRF